MSEREELFDQIWYGVVNSERLSRYYMAITNNKIKWNYVCNFSILFSSAAIPGSYPFKDLFGSHHPMVILGLSIAILLISIIASVNDFSRKAAATGIIADEIRSLSIQWKDLWFTRNNLNRAELTSKIRELKNRSAEITSSKTISFIHLTIDDKTNAKCERKADEILRSELFPEETAKA